MAGARSSRSLLVALLVALPLVATACGGDDGGDTTTTTLAPATTLPAMPADFDWWNPAPTPIGRGWSVQACEEDHPTRPGEELFTGFLCLENADKRVGLIELRRRVAPPDLDAFIAQVQGEIAADRRNGCGAEYEFTPDPIDLLKLDAGPTRRLGFTGAFAGAQISEHTVQWFGLRPDPAASTGALEIISIRGYDPGSCLGGGGEATLESLDEVIPGIEALIVAADFEGAKPR